MEHLYWESSCPSSGETAVFGMAVVNSSNPSSNLSGSLTWFACACLRVAITADANAMKSFRREGLSGTASFLGPL